MKPARWKRTLVAASATTVCGLLPLATGCDRQPDSAGEVVDDAIDAIEDAADDAGDAIDDATDGG